MAGVLSSRWWTVPREWSGETAFILGGGPSIGSVDVSRLPGRIIAVNNSWELRRDADVLYFCDADWWERKANSRFNKRPKSPDLDSYPTNAATIREHFKGKYIVTISDARGPELRRLRILPRQGLNPQALSTKPDHLAFGSNGGYQAMNLAALFGAARIVLLGFDLRVEKDAAGKIVRTHWHQGHGHPPGVQDAKLTGMRKHFARLVEPLKAAGVEVINASVGSALTCWPMRTIEELM